MKTSLATFVKDFVHGLAYLAVVLFSAAIVGYIVASFGGQGEAVGFQLATVSSVIGGLILAGGLLDRESTPSDLSLGLRRIGVTYLVATLGFVVFGICFPLLEISALFVYAGATGIAVGALAFATGSVLLATKVPRLLSGR